MWAGSYVCSFFLSQVSGMREDGVDLEDPMIESYSCEYNYVVQVFSKNIFLQLCGYGQ